MVAALANCCVEVLVSSLRWSPGSVSSRSMVVACRTRAEAHTSGFGGRCIDCSSMCNEDVCPKKPEKWSQYTVIRISEIPAPLPFFCKPTMY